MTATLLFSQSPTLKLKNVKMKVEDRVGYVSEINVWDLKALSFPLLTLFEVQFISRYFPLNCNELLACKY